MDPLFGSETRGRVLEQLAAVPRPQTGYRIAKAVGAEPIQVIKILSQLSGLTEHGPQGWTLNNDQLRRFLRGRMAHRAQEIRREKDDLMDRFGMRRSPAGGRR